MRCTSASSAGVAAKPRSSSTSFSKRSISCCRALGVFADLSLAVILGELTGSPDEQSSELPGLKYARAVLHGSAPHRSLTPESPEPIAAMAATPPNHQSTPTQISPVWSPAKPETDDRGRQTMPHSGY